MDATNVKSWRHLLYEEGLSVYQLNTDIYYGNYPRRLPCDYRDVHEGQAGEAR